MSVAYFIVLNRKIEDFDSTMDGKFLARAAEVLDNIAESLEVRPISDFLSADPVQAAEFLTSEGVDTNPSALPPLQQFSAHDGLYTVRALLAHVEAHSAAFGDSGGVIRDLKECERILSFAAQCGVEWHFEADF